MSSHRYVPINAEQCERTLWLLSWPDNRNEGNPIILILLVVSCSCPWLSKGVFLGFFVVYMYSKMSGHKPNCVKWDVKKSFVNFFWCLIFMMTIHVILKWARLQNTNFSYGTSSLFWFHYLFFLKANCECRSLFSKTISKLCETSEYVFHHRPLVVMIKLNSPKLLLRPWNMTFWAWLAVNKSPS